MTLAIIYIQKINKLTQRKEIPNSKHAFVYKYRKKSITLSHKVKNYNVTLLPDGQ